MNHCIFLHIQHKKLIHKKFKKFPHHTDGHGKTECHNTHIDRRQFKTEPFCAIQDIHHGKSDCCRQKAIERVQHGVPERKFEIKRMNFTQNLRSKNEQ